VATFTYVAVDEFGKKKTGAVEGDTARSVRQSLRDKRWFPLSVEISESKRKTGLFSSPSLSVTELALVTRQLSTLVSSGMPLEECLIAVAEQTEKQRIRNMIMSVRSKVLEGYSLATALAEYPRSFSTLYCATVEAGEQAGHLDAVLDKLAVYVEDQNALQRSILLASFYPIVLVVIALSVVIYLLQSVVPNILDVFVSSNRELPRPTQILLQVTEFLNNNGLMLLASIAAFIFMIFWWNKKPARRYKKDQLLLTLPIVGRFIKGFNTARFASTLATLGSSGVPLVDAMKIASQVIVNLPVKGAIEDATRQVSEGGSLADALKSTGYFPPMMIHMVASGENSGELEPMLERTAKTQESALKDLIQVMVALLEPLMLVIMGAIVLIIVMAVVLPITQINTTVG